MGFGMGQCCCVGGGCVPCAYVGTPAFTPADALCFPSGKVFKVVLGSLNLVNNWCTCCEDLAGPFYMYVGSTGCIGCCLKHVCTVASIEPFASIFGAYTHTFLRVGIYTSDSTSLPAGDGRWYLLVDFQLLYGYSDDATPQDVPACNQIEPPASGTLRLYRPFFLTSVSGGLPATVYTADLSAETAGDMVGPYTLSMYGTDYLGYHNPPSAGGFPQTCHQDTGMPATISVELETITAPPTETCGAASADCGPSGPAGPNYPADCEQCDGSPPVSMAITLSGFNDDCCPEFNDTFILDYVPSSPCCLTYVGDLPLCSSGGYFVDQIYLQICYDADSDETTITQGWLTDGNVSLYAGSSATVSGLIDCTDIQPLTPAGSGTFICDVTGFVSETEPAIP